MIPNKKEATAVFDDIREDGYMFANVKKMARNLFFMVKDIMSGKIRPTSF